MKRLLHLLLAVAALVCASCSERDPERSTVDGLLLKHVAEMEAQTQFEPFGGARSQTLTVPKTVSVSLKTKGQYTVMQAQPLIIDAMRNLLETLNASDSTPHFTLQEIDYALLFTGRNGEPFINEGSDTPYLCSCFFKDGKIKYFRGQVGERHWKIVYEESLDHL